HGSGAHSGPTSPRRCRSLPPGWSAATRRRDGSRSVRSRWLQPTMSAPAASASSCAAPRGSRIGHVREILFPNREIIARHLGPELRLGNRFLLHSRLRLAMDDRSSWPRSVAWFAETSPRYEAMLREVQGS